MKLFAQKEAAEFLKTGLKEFRYGREIRLTPGAKDLLVESGVKVIFEPDGGPSASSGNGAGAGATGAYERLFYSKEAEELKRQMCEIGRRMWTREYTDGNGGNISARLGDMFLCTPTGVSKGFMTPEMLCLVDIHGNQLAGTWKRTSEITTHMAIYKTTPEAKAVVHGHPVHATAYAIAGVEPPPCLIPEIEVFVGRVPVAPYKTPGSAEMASVIEPLAPKHQSIMMGNHGLITWGVSVEDAYFKMEITDAYCRTLIVASHIPGARTSIPGEKMAELLDMKKRLGLPDPRFEMKPVQLCEVDPWEKIQDRPCGCSAPAPGAPQEPVTNAEVENLVQRLTAEILESLKKEAQ